MRLPSSLSRLSSRYFELSVIQRLYANALISLLVALAALLVPIAPVQQVSWAVFFVYWLSATACDLLAMYHAVYATTLGKAVLLLLVSVSTNFAVVLAAQLVNSVTLYDPSKFPHTIALLAVLNIPFFVVAGFGLLYFVLLAGSSLLLLFHTLPDDRLKAALLPGYTPPSQGPFVKSTRTVRFISIAIFCGFVLSTAGKASPGYERFLSETTAAFIYHWEMYSKAPCNLEVGSKAAFVSDEKALVGQKSQTGYKFIVRECRASAA